MIRHALTRVAAPTAAPQAIGGLLSAAVRADTSGEWRQGVYIMPKAVPGWRLREDCGPAYLDYGLDDDDDPLPAGAIPFPIQTRVRARTSDLEELRQRAEMAIEDVTERAIARELWTGELTLETGGWLAPDAETFTLANPRPAPEGGGAVGTDRDGPWLNPYLRAAPIMLPAEGSVAAAVGAVEAAASRLVSGPVTIHVPTELILELSQFGITARGNELRTVLGSYVVVDRGYPGDDTAGATAVYATGPVQVWLDDAVRVHAEGGEVIRPSDNRQAIWAERDAAYLFDPQSLVGCTIT